MSWKKVLKTEKTDVEREEFEKKLFGNQKKIAEQAPPKNKIDEKDFKVLQAKKKGRSVARSVFTKR
jgi:hypothetical protein